MSNPSNQPSLENYQYGHVDQDAFVKRYGKSATEFIEKIRLQGAENYKQSLITWLEGEKKVDLKHDLKGSCDFQHNKTLDKVIQHLREI